MATDTSFLNRLLLAFSRGRVRLFRNSVGLGWVGSGQPVVNRTPRPMTVTLAPGDMVLRKARPLHAGLFKGSGDLVGWVTRTITEDMVGQEIAQFASLEAKEGRGQMRDDQKAWSDQVLGAGGIAGEVRSLEDAAKLLAGK